MSDLAALLHLKRRTLAHGWHTRRDREGVLAVGLGILAVGFWLGILGLLLLLLHHFFTYHPSGGPGIGMGAHALGKKLFSFLLMTYFAFLLFSSVINAVSAFFLSEELQLLAAAPVRRSTLFLIKYGETFFASAWMLFIFGLPLFLAFGLYYQWKFDAPVSYYFWMLMYFLPFLVLPTSLGSILAMAVVNAFPAQTVRDIFMLLGVIFAALVFIVFRMANPEQLLQDEAIPDVMVYLDRLEVSSNFLLPTEWIASGLYDLLLGLHGFYLFNWALMATTALTSVVLAGWIFKRLWLEGFHKAQESRRVRFSRTSIFERLLESAASIWPRRTRALIAKDARTFFRDPAQWTQLLLLGALIAVYLMYYASFPLEKIEFATPFLRKAGAGSFIAYLNIAMTAFVMTSLGARFIYPTVSLEGRAWWLVASAPITPRQFLRSKFWIGFLPTAIVAEGLIAASNAILDTDPFLRVLSMSSMLVLTFGIVALGIGLGARFPQFTAANATMIGASYGGIVYMVISMGYVFAVLTALFFPTRLYYEYGKNWRDIPAAEFVASAGLIAGILAATAVLVKAALGAGRKRLETLEGLG